MRTVRILLICALIATPAYVATALSAQRADQPSVDVQALGPQVGSRVPDFSLPDQTAETRTLRSILGPKGAVLVFFRSADW